METNQSNVHHFSANCGNLHMVTHAYAEFSDQEEVTDNGNYDVLQSDCHARCDQPGESRYRSQFGHKSKNKNHDNSAPDRDFPHQQKLVASPGILNISKGCASPYVAYEENSPKCDSQTKMQ